MTTKKDVPGIAVSPWDRWRATVAATYESSVAQAAMLWALLKNAPREEWAQRMHHLITNYALGPDEGVDVAHAPMPHQDLVVAMAIPEDRFGAVRRVVQARMDMLDVGNPPEAQAAEIVLALILEQSGLESVALWCVLASNRLPYAQIAPSMFEPPEEVKRSVAAKDRRLALAEAKLQKIFRMPDLPDAKIATAAMQIIDEYRDSDRLVVLLMFQQAVARRAAARELRILDPLIQALDEGLEITMTPSDANGDRFKNHPVDAVAVAREHISTCKNHRCPIKRGAGAHAATCPDTDCPVKKALAA